MPPTPPTGDKKNIVKMAYIYFQEGRWDKAVEEYKKLLTLDPEDINTHNMLGDVYVKKGAFREAYEEYAKVVADLTSRGQADKATIVNKKIASIDTDALPPEARAKQSLIKRTLKAEIAMEQGDTQTAIEAFGEVLKLDPENIGLYSKLAELLVSKGKIAEAVQQYAVMGAAYLKNRLYKKAQEAFQKILELDPNQVEARINLAQIFIKQGSESDAKKEFLTVAEIYLRQNDLDRAKQFAQKSVELKGIEAYFILGQVLFKRKQFAEAKTEFDNLLRFKVNHVGGLTYLGLVFLELNQLDKASEHFNKAQKLDKENPKVFEAMAELNLKKGLKNEAVAMYVQAANWYLSKKDHRKAVEIAKKAEASDNQSAVAMKMLAEALLADSQKGEATQAFLKAADLFDKKEMKDIADSMRQKAQSAGPDVAATVTSPAVEPLVEVGETAKPLVVEPPDSTLPDGEAQKDIALVLEQEGDAVSDNVVDLEESALKPEDSPALPVIVPTVVPVVERMSEPAQDRETELLSQMEIAANYIRQNLVEDAIEIYQQLLENYPDHPEVRAKLNDAYTLYVKSGEDVIGALEAERKAKEDEEQRLREELERRSREEAERKAKVDAERKAKEDAERRVREEAELRARDEALQKAKAEAERKAKEDQLQKAKIEAERVLRDEMERKAKDDLERRLRDEMERKVREETELRAKEEMERKIREELEKKLKEESERKAKEEALRQAAEEAERKAKDEASRKATGDAEKKLREDIEVKARAVAEKARQSDVDYSPILEPLRMGSGVPDATQSARLPTNDDSRDEFMTIAVADIYVRQGLFDEAYKIYNRIVAMEPDNYEAKKKISELENVMRGKGLLGAPKVTPVVSVPIPAVPLPGVPMNEIPPESLSGLDKEAVAKKKPGKVGYV
jgi:tetratricopeptide (TPR) repeat protein